MNILEGHPGGIFDWFFDTDQGNAQQRVQILFLIYGSGRVTQALTLACLQRQSEFNDVLGPEIMFLFFDPVISVNKLAADGDFAREHLERFGTSRYLFSGYGEARAIPPAMIEVGRRHFRSERPADYYNQQLSAAAANAHQRAIPFFQRAFDLEPAQSYMIWAHRTSRIMSVIHAGESPALTCNDLIALFRAVRPIARHSRGTADVAIIDDLVKGAVQHSELRSACRKSWEVLRKIVRPS